MTNGVNNLRDYELVFIVSPTVDAEKLEAVMNNVTRSISQKGGTVSGVEPWGKRKLAYPLKHFAEGNYVLAKFKLKPSSSKELEKELLISEDILRHLLIKVES